MAILSIQSHVVYGHAGNSAAVFPLQRLGREVWAINTVEFSNHTGYSSWRGKALESTLASDIVTALDERGVLGDCQAILSGYLGDASLGQAVRDAVKKIKKINNNALYCCDPVMGDTGRGLYVNEDIPFIFKNDLLPLADIACPNQFELETLTGIKTRNIDDAIRAIEILRKMGPSIVLVTSFREKEGELAMIASNGDEVYKVTTPEIPLGSNMAGAGDLTTAVFLSRYLETKNLKKTLDLCASSVYRVIEMSYNKRTIESETAPLELKIVEAQEELCFPSKFFESIKMKGKI